MKNLILLSNGGKNRNYEEYIYSKFLLDKINKRNHSRQLSDSQKLLKLINQLSKIYFDNIYAIGGGSVLDIAKVLSVFLPIANDHNIQNLLEEDWIFIVKKIYLTAIPTTSGTGAE